MDLTELESIAANCKLCELYKEQIKPVFARGNEEADILICGMCPGYEENNTGIPFVGAAGKILDKIIYSTFGSKDYGLFVGVYITNIVKCYVKAGTTLQSEWMDACLPYFIVQLQIVKPKVIIALGKDVSNFLLHKEESMGSMRGNVYNYMGIKLISTYHPSYLARGGGINHKHFNTVVKDFKRALKYV